MPQLTMPLGPASAPVADQVYRLPRPVRPLALLAGLAERRPRSSRSRPRSSCISCATGRSCCSRRAAVREPVRRALLLPLSVSARRGAGDPGAAADVRLAAGATANAAIPASAARNECPVQAIHPEGHINPNECIQCLHCQMLYHHDHKCPVMIQRRLKREKRIATVVAKHVATARAASGRTPRCPHASEARDRRRQAPADHDKEEDHVRPDRQRQGLEPPRPARRNRDRGRASPACRRPAGG